MVPLMMVLTAVDSKSRVIESERRDSAHAERLGRQAKAIGFDQTNYRRVQALFRAVHQAPGR